ncbi:MAG TPA: DEAD/DEAH box helicase family protein [Patescibacteria group bacterium]|nr:DEAD/DEAH box helicase family protein [Patescibacteria group bacterium]
MQLKIYQEKAIDSLLEKTKKLLGYSGDKKMVFKAPTGSGKTIMMAEFLKQLIDGEDVKQPLCFIWTAPRKLHEQSYKKLENYFEISQACKCCYFEDLEDRKISENEILFFNWESINKTDNIYIRDNEQEFNLSKVLERTKEEGRKIVLIIDEAHHHASSEISHDLIQMIGPKITIEVTATPATINDEDEKVSVQLEDVKKEGMIKKAVILNDDFENFIKHGKIRTQKLSGGTEELVIDVAIQKRQELVDSYKKGKIEINPLILIQLPDRKTSVEDRIRDRIESILKHKYAITTQKGNNKLAIWLSGEHINKDDIERHDSDVEVLIFKQAIALGWDCPRAQILVLFREWHSAIFSIQTVGRIMRMPEPEKGYYENEILNYGYVYTNIDNINIKEDMAKNYISMYPSKIRANYMPINLRSYYPKRHREKTRLSPLFTDIFLNQAKRYDLKNLIDRSDKKINSSIISDYKSHDIDALIGVSIVGDREIKFSNFDLQRSFDFFVRNNLTPFYPEDRSVGRAKESIYTFFYNSFGYEWCESENDIIQIVLSEGNSEHIKEVLNRAKEEYKSDVVKRETEIMIKENWNIPDILVYDNNYKKVNVQKSIMSPFFSNQNNKHETAFISYLEKSESVEWWFKNGDRDATFFAIPYHHGETKPFYVDFIVKLKNGRIGLFDPHGSYLNDFASKADGLYKYILENNKTGKNLLGGLVMNTDRNYRGRWIYFNKTKKEYKNNSFDNWYDLVFK